jgi:hypothetical protein
MPRLMDLVLIAANISLGIVVTVMNLRFWWMHRSDYWCWIKLLFAGMGLYWSVIYVAIAILPVETSELAWVGHVLIRPAITISLGLIAAAAIIRARG